MLDMPMGALAYARGESNYTGDSVADALEQLTGDSAESLLIESSLDFSFYKVNSAMVSAKMKEALLAVEKSDGWRFD